MFHPAAEPGAGAKTRLTFNAKRTRAAPRLRQSLAALGSGYGLNERGLAALGSGYALNDKTKIRKTESNYQNRSLLHFLCATVPL
jgi:hypothetical protein